jgi:hypothetical protein
MQAADHSQYADDLPQLDMVPQSSAHLSSATLPNNTTATRFHSSTNPLAFAFNNGKTCHRAVCTKPMNPANRRPYSGRDMAVRRCPAMRL